MTNKLNNIGYLMHSPLFIRLLAFD